MPIGWGTMGETSRTDIAVLPLLEGMSVGGRSRVFIRSDRETNNVAAVDNYRPAVHVGGNSMPSRVASLATYACVSSGNGPPARCSS